MTFRSAPPYDLKFDNVEDEDEWEEEDEEEWDLDELDRENEESWEGEDEDPWGIEWDED